MRSASTSCAGCLVLAGIVAVASDATASVASDILALTGRRTRLVWIRADAQDWSVQWSDDWAHPFGPTRNPNNDIWKIVVFDTEEGAARVLENTLGAYAQPMITPSGTRVIWTRVGDPSEIWVCNFDGTGKRMVRRCTGIDTAIAVADPGGVEWVYVGEGDRDGYMYQSIYRYQIDNPAVRELVWNKTYAWDQMGILRDGSKAGGCFPWNYNCGTVTLPNGTYVDYNVDGCNPCISPDGLRFWTLTADPAHSAVRIFNIGDTANYTRVPVNDGPGMNGDQIWFPKWSDFDPRIFTVCGPFPNLGNSPNGADVYLGRFNSSFTDVEAWVNVSANGLCETHARCWIGDIGPSAPVITSAAPTVAYIGGAYTYRVVASGNPAPTVAVTGLPAWLGFDGATDTISGTPTATGQTGTITVTATNGVNPPATQQFAITVCNLAPPEGSILREWWTGLGGVLVSDLTGDARYPDSPSGSDYPAVFEAPVNWGDNYGQRMRGFVYPPATGGYVFWIASDDASDLLLSTDESPANATRIAWVSGWTNSREWTKEASQRSAEIPLQAGRRYYVEARHKEGVGGDNLAVGWQLPGGADERPIPGMRLSPWAGGSPVPRITSTPPTSAMVGAAYVYAIAVAGDPVPTVTVAGLPGWLSFDGARTISGTPGTADVGTTGTITVTATSSQGVATQQFSITVRANPDAPSIAILSPVSGDVWYIGTTRRIRWTTRNLGNVVIYGSSDAGASFFLIEGAGVLVGDPRWGAFPWTVGTAQSGQVAPSTNCIVRLQGYKGEGTKDSGVFEIRAVVDGDYDGMDDRWEDQYLGGASASDGTGDSDGDGRSDLDEFRNGTDPTDPADPAGSAWGTSGFSCAPGERARGPGLAGAAALALLFAALGRPRTRAVRRADPGPGNAVSWTGASS